MVRTTNKSDGGDGGGMVAQKGLPALRSWFTRAAHVLGHRRLSDLDAQHQQLRRVFMVRPTMGSRGSYDGQGLGVRDQFLVGRHAAETSSANRFGNRGGASESPFPA